MIFLSHPLYPMNQTPPKGGTEDVVQKQEQHVNSLVWIVEAHGRLTRQGEEAQQHNFI